MQSLDMSVGQVSEVADSWQVLLSYGSQWGLFYLGRRPLLSEVAEFIYILAVDGRVISLFTISFPSFTSFTEVKQIP